MPRDIKTNIIPFRVRPSMKIALDAAAKHAGIPFSTLIQTLVENYLRRHSFLTGSVQGAGDLRSPPPPSSARSVASGARRRTTTLTAPDGTNKRRRTSKT